MFDNLMHILPYSLHELETLKTLVSKLCTDTEINFFSCWATFSFQLQHPSEGPTFSKVYKNQ